VKPLLRRLLAVVLAPSGPAVARLFQRALAAVFLLAWISLGVQVRTLIGERGLTPLWAFLEQASRDGPLPLRAYPSLLRWQPLATDGVLVGGTVLGAALALVAMAGFRARLMFALSTALYLSYAVACRSFLAFQWDNLLLECGLLAAFLPGHRPAPVAHLLLRLVAFKLYFQSGIAKWESPPGDWHDGSAMAFYYETAPLPTALAWFAHNLPRWWHHFESWATLVLELLIPFGLFGPRHVRLATAAVLTGFQVFNLATANYGFFCYLALALHLLLLDDADVKRAWAWVRARFQRPPPPPAEVPALEEGRAVYRALAYAGLGLYVVASLMSAVPRFWQADWLNAFNGVRGLFEPLRVVNTYHLFATITRERIEPEIQVQPAGSADWQTLDLRHKPGDPARRPGFVAPHQPRVDFQLWFHGLSHQGRPPGYLVTLLRRLCDDRPAVRALFATPPPRDPAAVRVVYQRYNFTTRAERAATGHWWRRTPVDGGTTITCTP
jgi:hypothetical protein